MLLKIVWVTRKPDYQHTVYNFFWAEKRWKRGATYIFRNFFCVSRTTSSNQEMLLKLTMIK